MISAAFETSTRSASVALGIAAPPGDLQVFVGALDSGRAHASDLLPLLTGLLDRQGLVPADLDTVIVGIGPGSYTGLRVGVATALGLALGEIRGKTPDLCGVPSCEALMASKLRQGESALWIQDARSGGFYVAEGRMQSSFEVVGAPRVVDREGLGLLLEARGGARLFGDPGTSDALTKIDLGCAVEEFVPTAEAVLELGRARLKQFGPTSPYDLAPLYLRPFAAKVRKR